MGFGIFFIYWTYLCEVVGLYIGRNTGSGAVPQPKQIITDFIYFKKVSFMTSDVSCYIDVIDIFMCVYLMFYQ